VRVVWGNFWHQDWPSTDGIYVFLLDKYMKKLDKKVIQTRASQKRPIKLLSFSFQVPKRRPKVQRQGLFLYEYN
jgi:hypothetical protein